MVITVPLLWVFCLVITVPLLWVFCLVITVPLLWVVITVPLLWVFCLVITVPLLWVVCLVISVVFSKCDTYKNIRTLLTAFYGGEEMGERSGEEMGERSGEEMGNLKWPLSSPCVRERSEQITPTHKHISWLSCTCSNVFPLGPLASTLVDFWRLVWQCHVPSIIMITNLKEGGKTKCERYWPDEGSCEYGPFKVTLSNQLAYPDYTIRILQVSVSAL